MQSAERASSLLSVRPTDRIMVPINDEQRVVLSGHRHPLAKAQYEIGEAPQEQRMERMILVLRADPTQEKVLAELIRAQQDPASPYYHQWLTPQSFGKRFGASQQDLNQIVGWLQHHGMQVDEIPASRRTIVFSGSVAQVASTFHTSIRQYGIKGQIHFANASDPEIPQALAGVVNGVVSLHDFRSAPQVVATPAFTASNGAHFLMPQDWNTIYDVDPLYSQGLDGTGQSIAVLGRVDISLQDIRTFRSNAGLPANDPQIIVNGPDPGFPNCDDEAESALDVEWAGAIAKNATVKFVTSKSGASDGIALSAQYAVANNVAPIVSLSYGLCEVAYSPSGNAFWDGLWSQAAAQGMSVFVSSGDSGAAGCDSPNLQSASRGRGVNALCSSPNSTCVGATQFDDNYNPDLYWSPTNGVGMSSALGYIPESVWNESSWSGGLWSTGGGASKVYAKPSWQNVLGVPADGVRDVPDVVMAGAIHDAYITQIQGQTFYLAGTSAATPSLASVMALVLENAGTPQGNANPILYGLANLQFSANGPAVFHDITNGNNSVPGVLGYSAGAGYDPASGLGSVDASLLVNHWNDASTVNFSLAAGTSSLSSALGGSSSVDVTETVTGGINLPVTLSASGLPAGVTVTFSSSTLTADTPVTVTVKVGTKAVAGTYPLTVTGTGGGLVRTLPLSLTVLAPDFTLTSSSVNGSVAPGSSIPITLSTVGMNAFKSSIALSVIGLPRGVTATFSPVSIASPGSGASTLKLTVASGTAAGTSTLTIKAVGGGLTRTSPFTITILPSSFTFLSSTTIATVVSGSPAKLTVSTTIINGFKSTVALSVIGLPRGVTASFSPASIASPGAGTSTLTLTETTGATAGVYNLTVKSVGGGMTLTQPLAITVATPSFSLTPGATDAVLTTGGSIPLSVSTAGINGFRSSILLSVSGLPKGVTATFSPSSIASPGTGKSTMTLKAASTATVGTYTLTLSAIGGGLTATQPINLTVSSPALN